MRKSFARQNEGLHALLGVLAQGRQEASSAADREVRREEMKLQLEQMRQNAVLNKEQLAIERMKTDSEIRLQEMQAKIATTQAEINGVTAVIGSKQALQAMTQAERAEGRATREEAMRAEQFASQKGQQKVEAAMRLQASYDAKIKSHDDDIARANAERAKAEFAIMNVFGTYSPGQQVEGGYTADQFVVSAKMSDVMANFIKEKMGLDPKDPEAQLRAARLWSVGIREEYGRMEKQKFIEINESRRAQGQEPINALSDLETDQMNFIKEQLTNRAFATYMKSPDGPLVAAVIGKIGENRLKQAVQTYGPDKAYEFLLSGLTIGTKDHIVHVGEPNTQPRLDALGRTGADIYVDETYGTYRGSLDSAVPTFYTNDQIVTNADQLLLDLKDGYRDATTILDGHNKAIMMGDFDGLDPGEVQQLTLASRNARAVYKPQVNPADIPGGVSNPTYLMDYVNGYFEWKAELANNKNAPSPAWSVSPSTGKVERVKSPVDVVMEQQYGLLPDIGRGLSSIGRGLENNLNKQMPKWMDMTGTAIPRFGAYVAGNKAAADNLSPDNRPTWMDVLKTMGTGDSPLP